MLSLAVFLLEFRARNDQLKWDTQSFLSHFGGRELPFIQKKRGARRKRFLPLWQVVLRRTKMESKPMLPPWQKRSLFPQTSGPQVLRSSEPRRALERSAWRTLISRRQKHDKRSRSTIKWQMTSPNFLSPPIPILPLLPLLLYFPSLFFASIQAMLFKSIISILLLAVATNAINTVYVPTPCTAPGEFFRCFSKVFSDDKANQTMTLQTTLSPKHHNQASRWMLYQENCRERSRWWVNVAQLKSVRNHLAHISLFCFLFFRCKSTRSNSIGCQS